MVHVEAIVVLDQEGRQLPGLKILSDHHTHLVFIVELYLLGDFMKKMWKGPVFHLICTGIV